MKRVYFLVFGIILLVFLSAFVIAKPKWKDTTCPITAETDIAFYGKTGFGGVGDLSKSWITHFLNWWKGYDSGVDFVELDDQDVYQDCDLDSFPNLKLYIQPGGNAYYQQNSLEDSGKQNIKDYIASGKGYLGICAGFYYAASDYYWQGEYYDWPDLLGLYPTVEGSIIDIADYEGNPDHKLTPLSNGFNAIYYGGPTRGWQNTPNTYPGVADATFSEIPGDLPAVIKYNNMLLTSVHLEAFEDDGVVGLTTEDRVENYKYLANLINEVAGTSFYVPEYTNTQVCGNNIKESGEICDGVDFGTESCESLGFDYGELSCLSDCSGFDFSMCANYPTECSDGIDNDYDNLTDYPEDPGCESFDDDSEQEFTGPVEVLFDSFEDGNLVEWNLYGTGRAWSTSTDTAYEGSFSVRAKKTGVNKDSFMEISFDVSEFDSVTFEYYRKLVGLDAADDFEVQYFDGVWYSVEHLGSARASDSNFVFKSFSIPSTATKIRFKCECGAVSEKCYVDNVRIVGE